MGVVLAFCAAHAVWADEITINPSQDNTLYEAATEKSNGAGDFFFSGHTAEANTNVNRRGLIEFDVASAVPAGSRIDSVTLTLYMSRAVNAIGAKPFTLYDVTDSWGEGTANAPGNEGGGTAAAGNDATWHFRFFSTTPWTTIGGDFNNTPLAETDVFSINFYTWGSTDGMVASVQSWLDNPTANFGWILIGDEFTQESAARFNTRQNVDSSTWPVLDIQYTLAEDLPPPPPTVPEPGSLVMITLAGAAILMRRGRK